MNTLRLLAVISLVSVFSSCGGGGEDKPNGPITPANVSVTSVSLSKAEAELVIGNTLQLTATVNPSNATDKNVTWNSSNATVATVTPTGLVTAKAEGATSITASCGGKSSTCKLTVKKPAVAVTSVELDKTEITLVSEETYTLNATVKPDNATDKTVTWTSSKPDIAKVDNNGKVTSVKEGKATITAKAGEKSASCIVTVISKTAAPLTFTATSVPVTISLTKANTNYPCEYRINDEDWKNYSGGVKLTTTGHKVSFRARSEYTGRIGKFVITGSGRVEASGNIMTLLKKEGDLTSVPDNAFARLFEDCTALTTAPELPATTLGKGCYKYMFSGCKNLKTAPKELPAKTLVLKDSCYKYMFRNCTALTTAPKLPATALWDHCYYGMFYGCKSLKIAPELPAKALGQACYFGMFYNCTNLTTAPELPATEAQYACYKRMFEGCKSLKTAPKELPAKTSGCCFERMFYGCTALTTAPKLPATEVGGASYSAMFYGCTALTTAPELPATKLWDRCYESMFEGCTALTTAPKELPATALRDRCYEFMFRNCKSLKRAPELPATTLAEFCYFCMFYNCSNLNYIKCLAIDKSASSCTYDWVCGVAASGTFVKKSSNSWGRGTSAIPEGWTVQNIN